MGTHDGQKEMFTNWSCAPEPKPPVPQPGEITARRRHLGNTPTKPDPVQVLSGALISGALGHVRAFDKTECTPPTVPQIPNLLKILDTDNHRSILLQI